MSEPEDHKEPSKGYTWTSPDGETLSFRRMTKLPTGVFRRARKMDELDATFELLEAGLKGGDKALEILDKQPADLLEEILGGWQAANRVTSGES